MATREVVVRQVLQVSGGKIVGKIRLQKMIYLFQQLGSGSNFRFSYHHYGPYAEEITVALQRATLADKSICETERISSFGGKYSEFELLIPENATSLGTLSLENATKFAGIMKAETSVVIELAATIHWLKNKEHLTDWEKELKMRKPAKATADNILRAQSLLEKLNLVA